jgi:hypothetical protein
MRQELREHGSAIDNTSHSKGLVEKHNKRHSEERSDVAISLAFNIRDCHAVARNDENRTFSTNPKLWGTHASGGFYHNEELNLCGDP